MSDEPEYPDLYRADLISLVESFEYELCAECSSDVEQHIFAPDIIGNPHAYCPGTFTLVPQTQ